MDQVFPPKTAAGMNITVANTESALYTLIDAASTGTTATFPTDPTALDIRPEDGDIRVTFHSSLVPTTTAGYLVKQGETLELRNRRIKEIHLISVTGNVKCSYEIGTARPEEFDRHVQASAAPAAAIVYPAGGYDEELGNVTVTGTIPIDDTIPQNTEGDEILSASITLSAITSKVNIGVHVNGVIQTVGNYVMGAVFRNAVANAIGVFFHRPPSVELQSWDFIMQDSPGIAGDVTYKVRIGTNSGNMYLNGTSGARFMGGASKCTLVLQEVKIS